MSTYVHAYIIIVHCYICIFNAHFLVHAVAVTAHVHDKIVLTGMGSMDIPVSDLGKPEDLLKIKKMDRLPYLIQKKTFLSLTQPFEDAGLVRIYNWIWNDCWPENNLVSNLVVTIQ